MASSPRRNAGTRDVRPGSAQADADGNEAMLGRERPRRLPINMRRPHLCLLRAPAIGHGKYGDPTALALALVDRRRQELVGVAHTTEQRDRAPQRLRRSDRRERLHI